MKQKKIPFLLSYGPWLLRLVDSRPWILQIHFVALVRREGNAEVLGKVRVLQDPLSFLVLQGFQEIFRAFTEQRLATIQKSP